MGTYCYRMKMLLTEKHSDAIFLRCPNVLCKHEWRYRGNSKFYASCTYCRTNVHVVRDRIQVIDENKKGNLGQRDQSQTKVSVVAGGDTQ